MASVSPRKSSELLPGRPHWLCLRSSRFSPCRLSLCVFAVGAQTPCIPFATMVHFTISGDFGKSLGVSWIFTWGQWQAMEAVRNGPRVLREEQWCCPGWFPWSSFQRYSGATEQCWAMVMALHLCVCALCAGYLWPSVGDRQRFWYFWKSLSGCSILLWQVPFFHQKVL